MRAGAVIKCGTAVSALCLVSPLRAQTVAASVQIASNEAAPADIVVTASRADLLGIAATASQGRITKEELELRPAYRGGELLESVPGLVVISARFSLTASF